MAIAQVMAHHLPSLRRYARALTGSQSAGDAYVAATLEGILSHPDIAHERSPKVALFRSFTTIWNSLSLNGTPESLGLGTRSGDRRLAQLTPKPKQAFLLVSLEGFTEKDAAEILDLNLEDVQVLLEEAGRELATEIATDVLIIEDEPLIAYDLEGLVDSLGHRVVGIARTHTEAVSIAKRSLPGLILADIKLGDGSSGIDAVNELIDELCVPVIFITAFPERLLTGERLEPAFLITKPFHPATVAAVMSQALFFECNVTRVDSSGGTMRQSKLQPSLFLELLSPQLSPAARTSAAR
jgi:DNA-directed RNA polymerase specialized sigma24 family protein/DNA-binding NarL/FixJ family response regulator